MTTEVDEAFAEWERRSRQTWRRMNWAYTAVFSVTAIMYALGGVPVLSAPIAFVAGWCFCSIKDKDR